MSNLSAAYLAAYVAFSVWAHGTDLSRKEFTRWNLVEIFGNILLVIAAVTYLHLPFRLFFGEWAALFFVIGLSTLFIFCTKKVRDTAIDPQMSLKHKMLFSIFGLGLVVIANIPLIWWGSQLLLN